MQLFFIPAEKTLTRSHVATLYLTVVIGLLRGFVFDSKTPEKHFQKPLKQPD